MKKRPTLPEGRKCRLCGDPIAFLESARSRHARISDQNLTIRTVAVNAQAIHGLSTAGSEVWVFVPHWSTCPKAAEYREVQILEGSQGRLDLNHEEDVPELPKEGGEAIDRYLLRMGRRGVPIVHDYRLALDEVEVDREGDASTGRIVKIRTGKELGR